MNFKLLALITLSVLLFSCNSPEEWKLSNGNGQYLAVDSINHTSDTSMSNSIKPYKVKLDSAMNEVIGYSESEYRRGLPNGLLNNLFSDMVYEVIGQRYINSNYKPDFALFNHGGLRMPIPKGDIIKSDIFQLMPFENESVICQLSGKQMNSMFQYIYSVNGQPVSNIKIQYRQGKLLSAQINGIQYDSTKTYNVLTSDYTARGGDNMSFFLEADTMILCGSLIRNDIFEYIELKKGKPIVASDEKRIIID